MYARHDLIWLTPLGWHAQLTAQPRPLGGEQSARHATTPGGTGAALAAVERWRDHGWPLIVRRSEPGTPEGFVCAGLAAPPDPDSGARLRIPLVIDARHIARHERPLPLHTVQPALPQLQQPAFAEFAAAAEQYNMRVYGSLAMQAITGQTYLHAASDIDIAFSPATQQELDKGVALLAAHAQHLPLDGEIIFPASEAVAWKEWHASRAGSDRVLVKQAGSVALRPAQALRMALEAA